MTRKGGKGFSERRSGIGEDERQPVMARLAARWKSSLEGPHEEAEIQRKALRRGKNWAFSEDTCLERERVRSKVTPRKVEIGLIWRR